LENIQDDPGEDIFISLSKIISEILRNMPEYEQARIIRYRAGPAHPSKPPILYRMTGNDDNNVIPCEVIESDLFTYITATLPADLNNLPYVDFGSNAIRIIVNNTVVTIVLDHPVDRIHSYYRVHRHVLDITLKKKPES
jgi:hypothetical protein